MLREQELSKENEIKQICFLLWKKKQTVLAMLQLHKTGMPFFLTSYRKWAHCRNLFSAGRQDSAKGLGRAYAQCRLPNSHKQEKNGNITWNKVNGKVTHTLCFARLESLYYTSYYFVNIVIQPPKLFPPMSHIEPDAVRVTKGLRHHLLGWFSYRDPCNPGFWCDASGTSQETEEFYLRT